MYNIKLNYIKEAAYPLKMIQKTCYECSTSSLFIKAACLYSGFYMNLQKDELNQLLKTHKILVFCISDMATLMNTRNGGFSHISSELLSECISPSI